MVQGVFGRTPLDPNQFISGADARVRGFGSGHQAKLAQAEQFLRSVGGDPNVRIGGKGRSGITQGIDPSTGLADPDRDFLRLEEEEKLQKARIKQQEKENAKALKDEEKQRKARLKELGDLKNSLRKEFKMSDGFSVSKLFDLVGTEDEKKAFSNVSQFATGTTRKGESIPFRNKRLFDRLLERAAIKRLNQRDQDRASVGLDVPPLGALNEGASNQTPQFQQQLANISLQNQAELSAAPSQPAGPQIGDVLQNKAGRRAIIVGFDLNGKPQIEAL